MIQERAYAKINLGLLVGSKREDGYHNMNSIMVPIDLYDELTFDINDEGGIILIDNTNIQAEENFVYKAALLFKEEYNISKGVVITLKKNIPSQAGLGGGSADAAATLRGLNILFHTNKSKNELALLASKLGSDMPFCIYQKPCYVTGRGEIISKIIDDYKKLDVAIIKPSYGLSTKEVYDNYEEKEHNFENKFKNIEDGLKNGSLKLLSLNVFNDLQDPAFKIKPELEDLYNKVKSINSNLIVQMTGSGTALFVLGNNRDLHKMSHKIKYTRIYITKLL